MYSTDAVPTTSRSWAPVPHKALFVRIEEDLVEDERRSLKGLLYGRIPAGKLQKYSVADIFRHMERMGQIRPTHLEPIAELMEAIHRNDWANKVRKVEEQTRAAAPGRTSQPSPGRRQYHTDGPSRKRTRDVAVSAGTSLTTSRSRRSAPQPGPTVVGLDSDEGEEDRQEEDGGSNGNGTEPEEPPVKRRAPADPITEAHLAKLAKKMKPGWKSVGVASFGANTADIDRWRTKYPNDRDMQIVEMFKSWKDKMGKKATLRTLCDKLEEAEVEYEVYSFLTEISE